MRSAKRSLWPELLCGWRLDVTRERFSSRLLFTHQHLSPLRNFGTLGDRTWTHFREHYQTVKAMRRRSYIIYELLVLSREQTAQKRDPLRESDNSKLLTTLGPARRLRASFPCPSPPRIDLSSALIGRSVVRAAAEAAESPRSPLVLTLIHA